MPTLQEEKTNRGMTAWEVCGMAQGRKAFMHVAVFG